MPDDPWRRLTDPARQAHHPAFTDHHARCRTDPELFFPEAGSGGSVTAKQLCRSCRHHQACLAWALDTRQKHGVWGGRTATERLDILQQQQRDAAHDSVPAGRPA